MIQQISTSKAKTHFLELIRGFENEDETNDSNNKIYITKRGKIVAVLGSYQAERRSSFQEAKNFIEDFASKHTLNLKKGETIKDLIEEGRRKYF